MTSGIQADPGITSRAFFLADYAAVESGKAYISGGFWDRISVAAFPSTALFSVVAVIHVPWSAYHTSHAFAVGVEDAAGNELSAGFDGEFQVSAAPYMQAGDPTIMPITALVSDLTFEAPGEFSFVLRINGTEIDRWPLRVIEADLSPEAVPGPPLPLEPAATPPAEQP